ncbi:hypothetical protein QYM18_14460 [Ectopseudomonas chengduensis]|nr:hypothetical protein [Pseudomonas chengduensis]WKC35674.1 hypothetical protein QYM18_14460 [Pseudomonas chengduensis]
MRFFAILSLLLLVGCGSIDTKNSLRGHDAFTATQAPTNSPIASHSFLGTNIVERCVVWGGSNDVSENEPSSCLVRTLVENDDIYKKFNGECLDDSSKNTSCVNSRKVLVDLAARVINENCSQFSESVFAAKLVGDAVTDVVNDALPLGSAAAAAVSPATSIGLSLSSVLLNSYDKADQQLFLKKTFQTFDRAIKESTSQAKEKLKICRDKPNYMDCTIYETLENLTNYANACSFRSALNTIDDALRDAGVNKALPGIREDVSSIKETMADFSKSVTEVKSIVNLMDDNADIPQLKLKLDGLERAIQEVSTKLPPTAESKSGVD